MSDAFDAYHKWLGIPPAESANGGPNHYRLLGLGLFESDADVIQAAADRQMAHVQTYKNGPQSSLSQKLLNEISAAKLCLLKAPKKSAYDAHLRSQLGAVGTTGGAKPAIPAAMAAVQVPSAIPRFPNPPGSGAFPIQSPGRPNVPAVRDAAANGVAVASGAALANGVSTGAAAVAAAAHLGANRPPISNRPSTSPSMVAPPPSEESERSWSIPPAAAVLAAASVVAVLLVIGIVLVLNKGNARPDAAPIRTIRTTLAQLAAQSGGPTNNIASSNPPSATTGSQANSSNGGAPTTAPPPQPNPVVTSNNTNTGGFASSSTPFTTPANGTSNGHSGDGNHPKPSDDPDRPVVAIDRQRSRRSSRPIRWR